MRGAQIGSYALLRERGLDDPTSVRVEYAVERVGARSERAVEPNGEPTLRSRFAGYQFGAPADVARRRNAQHVGERMPRQHSVGTTLGIEEYDNVVGVGQRHGGDHHPAIDDLLHATTLAHAVSKRSD